MEREETKKIIRIMCDSYPNFKPSNLTETVDVWNMMLSDYTYREISVALKAYILSDTSGFAPSIGQLVGQIHSMSKPQALNEMEAWALVSKAIRNSSYRSVEEFLRLPEEVQRAIGTPEQLRIWAIDEDYNETVVMSNFQRTYRAELEKNSNNEKLPDKMQQMIASNESPARLEMQKRIDELQSEFSARSQIALLGKFEEASISDTVMDSVHAELERIKAMEI